MSDEHLGAIVAATVILVGGLAVVAFALAVAS